MKTNFEKCFKWLMVDEGTVYTNDAADSGGPTRFGITLKDYRLYINPKGNAQDVAHMTMAQAKTIYKGKYWDTLDADKLPSGVDNACFNYGVLAGTGRPKADLKRFAGIVDVHKKIDAICDEMKAFLNNLATNRPKDERFRAGWNNRVVRLRKNSHALANDKISGPIAGGVAGIGFWGMFSHFIHAHPYVSVIAAMAITGLVWYVVHLIRNKVTPSGAIPVYPISNLAGDGGSLQPIKATVKEKINESN